MRLLVRVALHLAFLMGCDERAASRDAAMDLAIETSEKDAIDEPLTFADRLDARVDGRVDVTLDRRDAASPDVDATVDAVDKDAPDVVADVGDEGARSDASDAAVDVRADVFGERPFPLDGLVEGVDATAVDEGAVAFDVLDGCTVPRFGEAYDAGPLCSPGRARACTCSGGRRGAAQCMADGFWDDCVCATVDAGIAVVDGQVIVPEVPIPWIGRPRLLAPQSGMRVTSQRPTLRWLLLSGIDRARVELCADRPCARTIAQQEVRGDRWRPAAALPAGVVFWRVRGLDDAGAVRWTSATWEFGVRRRDLGVDTSYGALKDFNGDGYDDVVTNQDTTRKLIYTGSREGIASDRVSALAVIRDDGTPDRGRLLDQTGIGDFNGDGLADLAIGSETDRAQVYLGSRACVLARTSNVYRADIELGRDEVSAALSAGDFNGDGYADLVINSARMQLYLGGPAGPPETPADISTLTSNFAGFVGDINGDGYQDVLSMPVSERREIGGLPLLVLYGNPDGRLEFHIERLLNPIGDELPESLRTYFGFSLRWADLDEDGYMDGAISLPGRLYVYYGSPAGYTRIVRPRTTEVSRGAGLFGNFGGYVAHPADLDGDGHAEVLVSNLAAPYNEVTERNGPGRTYVFSRDASTGLLGSAPAMTIVAPPRDYLFGKVATPGDLDGDGYDDLVVGAYDADSTSLAFLHVYRGGSPTWNLAPAMTITREYAFNVQE